MGLIAVSDLELAYGVTIDPSDDARYDYYIDIVSSYIETETGQTFSEVTEEVQLCQTGQYGTLKWPALNTVTLVEELDPYTGIYTTLTAGAYAFNGIDTVYALCPYTTYRVTVSYGWLSVPSDIAGLAVSLVGAATGLETSSTGGVSKYRVGDVEETYGVVSDGSGRPIVTVTGLQAAVISAYSTYNRTWDL